MNKYVDAYNTMGNSGNEILDFIFKVCIFGSICAVDNEASHNLTALTKAIFITVYSGIYRFLISACFQQCQALHSQRSAIKIRL